ncbi:MAG: flagellar hook-associated protein FlgL [Gammaproteobacteria bacterium]
MRIATGQTYERAIAQMQARQARLARVNEEIGSGRKLLSAGDAPADAANVLGIKDSIAATRQYQTNVAVAAGRLEQADTVLQSVTGALQRVRELALRARNGDLGDSDRRAVALEVGERLKELIELGNTRDTNAEFLFAGSRTDTQPFALDAAGQAVYSGDQVTRLLQVGTDRHVADRDPGDAVFMAIRNGNGTFATDPAPGNTGTGVILPGSVVDATLYQAHSFRIVFTSATTFDVVDDTAASTVLSGQSYTPDAAIAFNGVSLSIQGAPASGDEFTVAPSANQPLFDTVSALAQVLSTPVSSASLGAALAHRVNRTLTDIDQALETVLATRSSIGARLNGVEAQKQMNADVDLHLNAVRSSLEDVDVVEASVRLNLESTALQAAQQAFVRTQNLSLFNYL